MRIACISGSQVPSTTANSIQLMKTCHALAEEGHTPRLWVPGAGNSAWEELAEQYGLHTKFSIHWLRSTPALKRYDFSLRAVWQARSWGADLIYTWLPQAAVMALRLKMATVLELHDRPSGRLGARLVRQFAGLGERKRLLVITHALQRALQEEFHIQMADGQIEIAPNGTDPQRYAALPEPGEARRQLGLPEGFSAVYAGHFYAGRGMSLLQQLAQGLPDIRFLWVGGREEDVKNWRERLEAESIHNVTLTGFIQNARLPLYQAAGEVLLMPYERSIAGSSGGNSADICSPMKMFDYLACGRAILSSDLPVLHEVLNENNAVFAPPENVQAWSAALRSLQADTQRRSALGRQARMDAERFSWRERARKALAGF